MASSPITSWQIDGEKVETVTDFLFFSSKITVDIDCNHKIKRHLLLGRKPMTNLDSVLKGRDITFLTKIRTVKAMIFPVIMYGYESGIIKKAERYRIYTFKLCWRRLLESLGLQGEPANRKGNQPWIFIGRTDAEAEAPILWPPDAKS